MTCRLCPHPDLGPNQLVEVDPERVLLERSQIDKSSVTITVTGCAYACCGRGWRRRDGYEQVYTGWIDNLDDRTFMLYSPGIGTISYVVAVRLDELLGVEPANYG